MTDRPHPYTLSKDLTQRLVRLLRNRVQASRCPFIFHEQNDGSCRVLAWHQSQIELLRELHQVVESGDITDDLMHRSLEFLNL